MRTRLALSATPGRNYGSFAGKSAGDSGPFDMPTMPTLPTMPTIRRDL